MQKIYTQLILDEESYYYLSHGGLYFPFSFIKLFLNYNMSDERIDDWLNSKNLSGETPTIFVDQIDENTIEIRSIIEIWDYEEKENAPEPEILTLTPTNFIYLLKTWKEILQEKPPICYLTYDEETNWINLTANPDDINGFEDSNARDIH